MAPTQQTTTTQEELNSSVVKILSPQEHPITLGMFDQDALNVLKKLNKAGFTGYLVGGGVRDLYLGKTPKDFDISTDARPGQIRKIFPNSRTIGRRFRLVQVFFKGGKTIEVSTLRSLSEHDIDGPEVVLAPNNTFGTLNEDARRRDLTINALFYEIENNNIIDYVNGIKDLEEGVIRVVGDPHKRFGRDPVRMMRAVRHSARTGFTIETETWNSIISNCDKLTLCPPSRIRDEVLKDFYSGASAPWFQLAFDSGIFTTLFPLYKRVLKSGSLAPELVQEQLGRIFQTIDRIDTLSKSQNIHRQPDFFLFALMLTPWVESRFQLFSTFRKGADLFQLAKEIRTELDQSIGIELNLRRSLRQDIVSLLTSLSQLIHHKKHNSWPAWLRKKSYFPKSSFFYRFYLEATSETPISSTLLAPEKLQQPPPPHTPTSTSNEHKTPKAKSKPAFAENTKGGVFGFKK